MNIQLFVFCFGERNVHLHDVRAALSLLGHVRINQVVLEKTFFPQNIF